MAVVRHTPVSDLEPKATIADAIERSPNALKVGDLTQALGISDQTIYRMVDDHSIPHFRVRGAIRFCPKTIARWIRENSINAT